MRLIWRYVLIELLWVFVLALCAITLLFVFHGIIQELVLRGLGPSHIARMLPYLLPSSIRTAIQGAVLFSVCSVFGRMAASNELLAANSLGIASSAVVWPALVLATALSLFCVWLNDINAWWGHNGIQMVVLESAEDVVYRALRAERSYTTKQIAIHVAGMQGSNLVRPTIIYWSNKDGSPVTLSADSGWLRTDLRNKTLSVVLQNGTVDVDSETSVSFPETLEHVVPLGDAARDEDWPAERQRLWLIGEEIVRQRKIVTELARLVQSSAKPPKNADKSSLDAAAANEANREKLRLEEKRLSVLETRPHRRWANGFCCLSFAMIGIPVAIRMRGANYLTSFLLCILPIILAFQPLQFFGIELAEAGRLPPWSTWFGNVLFMACGAWMMHRTFYRPCGV